MIELRKGLNAIYFLALSLQVVATSVVRLLILVVAVVIMVLGMLSVISIMAMTLLIVVVSACGLKAMVTLRITVHVGVFRSKVLRLMDSIGAVRGLRNVLVVFALMMVVMDIVVALTVIFRVVRSVSLV